MAAQVVARFLVDRPIRPGMVRAILDTLTAQGGAYVPQLVRRSQDESLRRVTGGRPPQLLDEVGEGGTHTTFLRVSEALPEPMLSFSVSETPRTNPTRVALTVPGDLLRESTEIERMLGVCKGLYLFLESLWGVAGFPDPSDKTPPVQWANFLGPELVARIGPARLLTSMAFIVEILPDGGIMLVTHPAPDLAATPEGTAFRLELGRVLGFDGTTVAGESPFRTDPFQTRNAPGRLRATRSD